MAPTPDRQLQFSLIALGAALLFWVGAYMYWRWQNSMEILSDRFVFVPEWVPAGVEKIFQPLAALEGWINREEIIVGGLGESFPDDAVQKATDEALRMFHEKYEPVQGEVPQK